jgi:hypothetical protein
VAALWLERTVLEESEHKYAIVETTSQAGHPGRRILACAQILTVSDRQLAICSRKYIIQEETIGNRSQACNF